MSIGRDDDIYEDDRLVADRRERWRRREDVDMFESFNSNNGGLPPWVQTALILAKIVGFIGAPTVIAVFLVYQGSNWLPKLSAQETEALTQGKATREAVDRLSIKQDQTYRLLQRICSNTAKTSEDRQRCFDP